MKNLKYIIPVLLILIDSYNLYPQNKQDNLYHYSIDLNNVIDKKIHVELIPPIINSGDEVFHLPKMVPGTYSIYDFGRFVSNFKAVDNNGNKISVTRIDSNNWSIPNSSGITKITYDVEDDWHTHNPNNKIFEPAGLNLTVNKNFVLNNFCLYGYINDDKNTGFEITIIKPQNFYGSTALIPVKSDGKEDVYKVDSYFELSDCPIMYDKPDTTVIRVGETQVLVSVYSPDNKITSKSLAAKIKDILEVQRKYLGGTLPVKKYAYLYYFVPLSEKMGGSFGALEHNRCSMYFLPEMDESDAQKMVLDASAHEFFHVITPLSVHSEEIQNFDFENPKMSEHLWLYEGMTEYTAMICQVKEGFITRDEFLDRMKQKILTSGFYNDTLPFTEMSLNALDKYNAQYGNVYQKGALIGMCLDLKLLSLSDGKFGVREMMKELSKRYGKNKAFKDSELFDEITSFTYPEIRDFFRLYVEGPNALPYKDFFNLAGVTYEKKGTVKEFTLGKVAIAGGREDKYMQVIDIGKMNDFGKEMGYKKGDQIKTVNGIDASIPKYKDVMKSAFQKSKEGDILTLEVLRKDDNGNEQTVTLKAKMYKVDVEEENVMSFDENATEQQLKTRDTWLGETN